MTDRAELLNDAETAMRYVLDGRQATLWSAIPGIVQSVDFSEMTCVVQPSVQVQVFNEDGSAQYVNLPVLVDVPIVFPSAGGFTLTLPIALNDEVLVVFSSRCIDSWWQNGTVSVPPEFRMHDLSDGFAIPGPRSQPRVIGSISSSSAQLRKDDGSVFLEITSSGVHVKGDLNVTGKVIATGDVTAGAISLQNHTHTVSTAPGVTGPAM